MDRIRDGRRGGGGGVSVGGGPPPPPRRRLRSNGGGGGGPRDSPRSERRRGERLMLNGGGGAGGGRDDGDDTSDDSLGDDDDDAEEELAPRYQPSHPQQRRSPNTAPPPPSPPQQQGGGGHHHSSSSSGGGGGYHNHHHHHHGQSQQMQRKAGPSQKSPIVLKAADEMIGVPVPRKARSASTKRSSHEWPVPGGGSSGGGGSGAGDNGSQIQRPSSRPISPASASTTAPARKKLKPLGGSGSSVGSGQAPKQRPSPSPAPSTTPPQPPPPKMSKSSSFIQEEIEVAEVLFGLTRQFPGPPKQENNHKLEQHRDPPDTKSGNSSPAPSSSVVRPSDSSSLATVAPKRKRPRLVKYDEDSRPASPAKPETAEPSSRPEAPPAARSEAKASTSPPPESGASTAPVAAAQVDAPREPEKTEDRGRSRDSEHRPSESDRRDHRPESRLEPPPAAPSGKPDGEAAPVGSEAARNGEATATTKIELASDGARQEKFCIDLMAPPPGKLSPDRDGASDPDADKGLDSGMDMSVRVNSEKKDGERTRRGLDIDLEDQKVQRIPADELAPRKLTLQLDLEKPSLGDEKSPSERRQPQPPSLQQQQKSSKSEIKHEKSAMPAATPPMPIPVGGWLGSFPPFGYLGPVPALSAAGLHPMDVKPGSSSGLPQAALIPPPPTRSKRCATHCFVAQLIQYHQRIAKMNSFWPPAAAAAAAAANRSGPFFGPRPFNMGVVPPADAASLLVNPMQGSYPVRAHTPLQESKAPTMANSPFQGALAKDKAALGNAAAAESSQRKQPPAHETQQSSPMPNMLQGPAFIFPFNQQQAAAMAAASAANRAGDAKSSGASNAMQPSANAHAAAANPGAAAMNLSFANLQPADAQFLAILQNGAYPFQVAAHAGGPPSYRGMAPPGSAVPYFNGHVYPSHMLHPSQQQGAQPQSLQKNPMSSMSNSSQKHQSQSQGLLGYAPNANPSVATAANNSQNYSSGNQRSVLLPGHPHRQDSDKTGQDVPSSDEKSSHPQKGGYDHNFTVPVQFQSFAFAPQAAGSQNEKKSSDRHNQQQQPQASRGQGVRIDLASSQPFVMPFGSIGPPGSASTGLDFSLAQSHAMFQSHHEAARHGYPQLNFAAAQSAQATQQKPQHHQITGETKSVADSSSTPSAGDNERKKSASTKYPGDSQQHSLSFSRTESKSYGPPFLSGTTNENSSRTLSLIGAESPNAFGSKSSSSSTPTAVAAAAASTISQMQHLQQQHFLQMNQKNQQQFIQQHHLNRPRSAAPSTPSGAGGYPDRLANFQSMMYQSGAAQGGSPGQSPQLKASSARVTTSSAAGTSPAPPSNLIVMKNSGQQAKGPMQALSSPGHQSQSSLSLSSSKMGPSVTNISTGGGDLSRSSNAPVASGSPSNSVSKSTGGSPPATGSAKGIQQSVQLSSPQQSAKNPASTSGSKSTPTTHYSMPMPSILGQQPNVSPASNPGSKQQSHMPPSSMKQQPFPQGHFFISNTYAPQAPGPGGTTPLGLYPKRSADKTQQQVPHQQNAMSGASNNMKTLHPASGSFMHLAAAAQSAGGVPHTHMSAAQLTFGAMPMPVKPSSDQKPAAGK